METHLEIITPKETQNSLSKYESSMLYILKESGLPHENILVGVNERVKVFKNLSETLELLSIEKKGEATYLSKYLAAVSSGLFDAALNYLWDETILQLRKRVAHYDIQYFYDVAVNSTEKRKKLNDVEDLIKLDDSSLIQGAKEIGLISDIGYQHLDNIKYMRNWASAAHPNQVDLTGLQLITWLETCIKEVISLPESNVTIQIGKLLKNIKSNIITKEESDQISALFCTLVKERLNSLAHGLFGIYTRKDTTQEVRQNIHLLMPSLWLRLGEDIKNDFGIKYARFTANNDQEEAKLARGFLQIVRGFPKFSVNSI